MSGTPPTAQLSPPEVSIEGYGTAGGVLLQCESGGWPAEPELEWRDSEGRLLPADVTHRHPDPDPHQRYTVTSRVTVQKTDTNRFTCRVHLQGLNQTRETEIHVPGEVLDHLFKSVIHMQLNHYFVKWCNMMSLDLLGLTGHFPS